MNSIKKDVIGKKCLVQILENGYIENDGDFSIMTEDAFNWYEERYNLIKSFRNINKDIVIILEEK